MLLTAELGVGSAAELAELGPARARHAHRPAACRSTTAATSPTASVRVQDLFGTTVHPTVAGGRVPITLELLSPADRPIQITADLPGFWAGTWAEVRKEMAGRYPKHQWPADPAVAPPKRSRTAHRPATRVGGEGSTGSPTITAPCPARIAITDAFADPHVRGDRGPGFHRFELVHRAGPSRRHTSGSIDALVPEHGGDCATSTASTSTSRCATIGDPRSPWSRCAGADVVFNLAGQVSHTASMRDPLRDLHLNAVTHAQFLETSGGSARRPESCTPRPARCTAGRCTSAGRRDAPDQSGRRQRRRQAGRRTAAHLCTPRPTSMPTTCAAPDQRVRTPPASHQRRARLPAGVRPQGAAGRGRSRSSATACSAATACYVDDVVDALHRRDRRRGGRRGVQRRQRRSITRCAEIARDHGRGDRRAPAASSCVPWPDDHERIDIGSFHTDSTRSPRRSAGSRRIDLDDGMRPHRELLPGASVVPVVDLSRRGQRLATSSRRRRHECAPSGSFLLGEETARSSASSSRGSAARHARRRCRPERPHCSWRWRPLGVGPGDEVHRARVHRGADGVGRVPRWARCPCRSTSKPTTARTRSASSSQPAAPSGRGRSSSSTCTAGRPTLPATDLAIVEDAAQAHGALATTRPLGGHRLQLLSDQEPGRHRRRWCGGHRRRRRRRRGVRRLRVHGMTEQYVHTDVSQNFRMSEIEAAWLRLALDRARRRQRAPAARSPRRYREPRRTCGGRPITRPRAPPRAWSAPPIATASAHALAAAASRPPCTTRSHHPAARVPATSPARRARRPRRGPPSASRVPCFPELTDDEVDTSVAALGRHGSGREPMADRPDPTVASVSAMFPCYNDATTIGGLVDDVHDGAVAAASPRSRSSSSTTARPTAPREVLDQLATTRPWLRVVHHESNRGTARR